MINSGQITIGVSIPFKRESGFKAVKQKPKSPVKKVSIPFKRERRFKDISAVILLKTYYVSIPFKRERRFKVNKGQLHTGVVYVSIPFKRERGFKDTKSTEVFRSRLDLFQFPSNGKGDSKHHRDAWCRSSASFQFPSNGKGDSKQQGCQGFQLFQSGFNSLQTGKWIQSLKCYSQRSLNTEVSISFKRESGFKDSFDYHIELELKFQFPSNGKGDSKRWR